MPTKPAESVFEAQNALQKRYQRLNIAAGNMQSRRIRTDAEISAQLLSLSVMQPAWRQRPHRAIKRNRARVRAWACPPAPRGLASHHPLTAPCRPSAHCAKWTLPGPALVTPAAEVVAGCRVGRSHRRQSRSMPRIAKMVEHRDKSDWLMSPDSASVVISAVKCRCRRTTWSRRDAVAQRLAVVYHKHNVLVRSSGRHVALHFVEHQQRHVGR